MNPAGPPRSISLPPDRIELQGLGAKTAKRTLRQVDRPSIAGSLLSPIYRGYERHLLSQVRKLAVPSHVGLILDGNRRYGRQRSLTSPREIYALGADKL